MKYNQYQMIKRAGCIILCQDELLVVYQNNSGYWGFPKGSLCDKEHIRNGAIRETLEETGVNLSKTKFVDSIKHKGCQYFITVLDTKPVIRPVDTDEIGGHRWVTLNALERLFISPSTASIAAKLRPIVGTKRPKI